MLQYQCEQLECLVRKGQLKERRRLNRKRQLHQKKPKKTPAKPKKVVVKDIFIKHGST
jgi:hypothetical protein